MLERLKYEVAVVGGGPGGMAAAFSAVQSTSSVVLLESALWLGGQVWSGGDGPHADRTAKKWFKRIQQSDVKVMTQSTVIGAHERTLRVDTPEGLVEIAFGSLIIATGAREVFIPFPGWTLPHVFGVGALHNLAKQGWPMRGKRVVVTGSGPLLIAVAAHLRQLGAVVVLVAEQTGLSKMVQFAAQLPLNAPSKLMQGAAFGARLAGVPIRTHCWPVEAMGTEKLERVRMTNGSSEWDIPCDYLACAFGLTANLELPHLLRCRIEEERVSTDSSMLTSIPNVYCVGEPTGIGGVDSALTEGTIAGFSAVGQTREANRRRSKKRRMDRFGEVLRKSYEPRAELRKLARPDTILCRCEDVTVGQIRNDAGWREAKLYRHVGMGACQGRTCGGAVRFLFGWEQPSVRPPLFPVELKKLTTYATPPDEHKQKDIK